MDGQRFDEIARVFASGASRRKVIKALTASMTGVVAAAFVRRGDPGALAGCGSCGIETEDCSVCECCGGFICYFNSCCSGADDGESCTVADDCCGGFCNDGTCNTCGAGSPCDGECCTGFTCDNFECVADEPECSIAEGDCIGGEGCCEDLVCNGFSACAESCAGEREACEDGSDCCYGAFCQETVDGLACVSADSCLLPGDPCQGNQVDTAALVTVCCEDSTCIDDVCVADTTCAEEDDECAEDEDCCGDLICSDGACAAEAPVDTGGGDGDPVVLPNTGTGSDASSLGGLLTGLGAAGVAAMLAGKKLRENN